jgi:hypothetical protein
MEIEIMIHKRKSSLIVFLTAMSIIIGFSSTVFAGRWYTVHGNSGRIESPDKIYNRYERAGWGMYYKIAEDMPGKSMWVHYSFKTFPGHDYLQGIQVKFETPSNRTTITNIDIYNGGRTGHVPDRELRFLNWWGPFQAQAKEVSPPLYCDKGLGISIRCVGANEKIRISSVSAWLGSARDEITDIQTVKETKKKFSIYQLANGFLKITLPSEKPTTISIYNTNGSKIFTESNISSHDYQINKKLAKGVYYVKVTNEKKSFVESITIMK